MDGIPEEVFDGDERGKLGKGWKGVWTCSPCACEWPERDREGVWEKKKMDLSRLFLTLSPTSTLLHHGFIM